MAANDAYLRPVHASMLQRMMFLDLQITLADNDLRKVRRTCQLAGIDVRFPMLDDDVIAFSSRIPESVMVAGNRLRHFFRTAMNGFLPAEILEKKKHGFGLPFALWINTEDCLKDIATSAVSSFRDREILAASLIDQVLDCLADSESKRFGGLAWEIMSLELWLQERGF